MTLTQKEHGTRGASGARHGNEAGMTTNTDHGLHSRIISCFRRPAGGLAIVLFIIILIIYIAINISLTP